MIVPIQQEKDYYSRWSSLLGAEQKIKEAQTQKAPDYYNKWSGILEKQLIVEKPSTWEKFKQEQRIGRGGVQLPWEKTAPKIAGKSIAQHIQDYFQGEQLEPPPKNILEYAKGIPVNLWQQLTEFVKQAIPARLQLAPEHFEQAMQMKPPTEPPKSVMEPKPTFKERAIETAKFPLEFATYIPKVIVQTVRDPQGMLYHRPLDVLFVVGAMGGRSVYKRIEAKIKRGESFKGNDLRKMVAGIPNEMLNAEMRQQIIKGIPPDYNIDVTGGLRQMPEIGRRIPRYEKPSPEVKPEVPKISEKPTEAFVPKPKVIPTPEEVMSKLERLYRERFEQPKKAFAPKEAPEPIKFVRETRKRITNAKQQKQWLLEEVDKAMEKAPEAAGEPIRAYDQWSKRAPIRKGAKEAGFNTVVFEVPGDGVFEIINTKPNLELFRKQIRKWPTQRLKPPKPTIPSLKPKPPEQLQEFLARPEYELEARRAEILKKRAKAPKPTKEFAPRTTAEQLGEQPKEVKTLQPKQTLEGRIRGFTTDKSIQELRSMRKGRTGDEIRALNKIIKERMEERIEQIREKKRVTPLETQKVIERQRVTELKQIEDWEKAGKVEKLRPTERRPGGEGVEYYETELTGLDEVYSGYPLLKEAKEGFKRALKGDIGVRMVEAPPQKTAKPIITKTKKVKADATKIDLDSYTIPTDEPLIIVKQKNRGSMPIFKHEIDPFLKPETSDLTRSGFKYSYENPIRVFEEYPSLKKAVYDSAQVANKGYATEYSGMTKQIRKWKHGVPHKSAERLGAYAVAEQEGGMKILEAMGKTKPELTPAEMKIYKAVRNKLDDYFSRLNKARDLAGKKPLKYEKNYFTWMRNFQALEEMGINPIFDDVQILRKHLSDPSFKYATKRRMYKGEKLDIPVNLNFFDVLDGYSRLALRYIHRTPVLAKGRAFIEPYKFRTGKYRKGQPLSKQWSFKEEYPRLSAWLTQWLDTYSGRKTPPRVWGTRQLERVAGKLNRNIGVAILTYNVRSALIQMTALRNSYINLGEHYLMRGVLENLNPAKRRMAMSKSNVLRPRKIDVHIEAMLENLLKRKYSKAGRQAARVGISPLQWLDMEAARITWLGAYDKALNVLKKTPKEAVTWADDVVTRTQASGQVSDIAPIQRTAYGKLATLFQTFVINEWNFLSKDVLGYKNPKINMGQRAVNAGRLVLSTAMANALFEGVLKVRSPFPAPEWAIIRAMEGDEDDWKKLTGAALKESAEQIPVFGGGIRWAAPWRGMPLPAGAESIKRGIALVPKILETGISKTSKEDLETVARLLGIPGTGQLMKYLRRRERGMTHAEAIIGIRTDVSKEKQKYFHVR